MFTHPARVCMTYAEHCRFSLSIASLLFMGACKACIHALWPDAYITSTSDLVVALQQKLQAAGCR